MNTHIYEYMYNTLFYNIYIYVFRHHSQNMHTIFVLAVHVIVRNYRHETLNVSSMAHAWTPCQMVVICAMWYPSDGAKILSTNKVQNVVMAAVATV